MLERFSERSRGVMQIATEEAKQRAQRAVTPEHLLIAILRRRDVDFLDHLDRGGCNLEMFRQEVEQALAAVSTEARNDFQFSPQLRLVLETAMQHALRPSSVSLLVEPEHLLWALGIVPSRAAEIITSGEWTRKNRAFRPGDRVRVSDGPYCGFVGIVEHLDAERMQLRVTLPVFGSLRPVDLESGKVRFAGT